MSLYERVFASPNDQIEKPRKSWDIFKAPKILQVRNKTFYKPLKQPIFGFQEGLFFVHRTPEKAKTSALPKSQTKTPAPVIKKKDIPSPFKFLKEKKLKMPFMDYFDIIVKPSKLSNPVKIVRPSIVRRKVNKFKECRFAKKSNVNECDDLKAWNNESFSFLLDSN